MMPDPAAEAGHEAERLNIDLLHLRVEVGQQQPGQLQVALIHYEPAHRGGCIRAGAMNLAVPGAHLTPRNRTREICQPQAIERELLR